MKTTSNIIGIVLILLLVGCATNTSQKENISSDSKGASSSTQRKFLIKITKSGKIEFEGKEIISDQLLAALKGAGADGNSKIQISTTKQTEYKFVQEVLKTLAAGNYVAVKIEKPK